MKYLFLLLAIAAWSSAPAQTKEKRISLSVTNQHTAFPFSKFGNLFSGPLHPGFETGYGFNWRSRKKHDLFQWFKAGYFYHRFVQHAFPLYTESGYRYKFSERIAVQASLGAGLLYSITDAAVLHKTDNGDYEQEQHPARAQAMFSLTLGPEYTWQLNSRPMILFVHYQQRLQTPFIKSYVPLLPYNQVAIGAFTTLKGRK